MRTKSALCLLSLTLGTLGVVANPSILNAFSLTNGDISITNQPPAVNLIAQGKNPYDGKSFNATTFFKCSVNNTKHDKECPAGIIRKNNQSASITVLFTNKKEVTYNFQNCPYDNLQNCKVTSNAEGKLDWGKEADNWFIGINNQLFIIIPDAAIYGG